MPCSWNLPRKAEGLQFPGSTPSRNFVSYSEASQRVDFYAARDGLGTVLPLSL